MKVFVMIAVASTVLSAQVSPVPAVSASLPTQWEELYPAIVKVLDSNRLPVGTGFVVGSGPMPATPGLRTLSPATTADPIATPDRLPGIVPPTLVFIVTADHVVADIVRSSNGDPLIVFHGGYDPVTAQIVKRSDTLDLAVLAVKAPTRIPRPTPTNILRSLSRRLKAVYLEMGDPRAIYVSELVTAIGHPDGYEWVPALNNQILQRANGMNASQFTFQNTSIDHGNSGGPVFLGNAEIIGMVVQRTTIHTIALKIDVIRNQLEKTWQIPFTRLEFSKERNLREGRAKIYDDPPGAFAQLKKASDEGSAEASYLVSQALSQGRGTAQDLALAKQYLVKSADGNYIPAMVTSARNYKSVDVEKAGKWLSQAAQMGSPEAMLEIAASFNQPALRILDSEPAFSWFKRAADTGDPRAMYVFGRFLIDTPGRSGDSCKLFRDAAVANWVPAFTEYGDCIVKQDPAKAKLWYQAVLDETVIESKKLSADFSCADALPSTFVPPKEGQVPYVLFGKAVPQRRVNFEEADRASAVATAVLRLCAAKP
jgi:hypothetical protein